MPRFIITELDRPHGDHVESIPVDLCQNCYRAVDGLDEEVVEEHWPSLLAELWTKQAAVDWNCDHPPYDDEDGELARCAECNDRLTDARDCYTPGTAYFHGGRVVHQRGA